MRDYKPKNARTLNLLNISNIQIEGIDKRDYPDFCDAYVSSAMQAFVDIARSEAGPLMVAA